MITGMRWSFTPEKSRSKNILLWTLRRRKWGKQRGREKSAREKIERSLTPGGTVGLEVVLLKICNSPTFSGGRWLRAWRIKFHRCWAGDGVDGNPAQRHNIGSEKSCQTLAQGKAAKTEILKEGREGGRDSEEQPDARQSWKPPPRKTGLLSSAKTALHPHVTVLSVQLNSQEESRASSTVHTSTFRVVKTIWALES